MLPQIVSFPSCAYTKVEGNCQLISVSRHPSRSWYYQFRKQWRGTITVATLLKSAQINPHKLSWFIDSINLWCAISYDWNSVQVPVVGLWCCLSYWKHSESGQLDSSVHICNIRDCWSHHICEIDSVNGCPFSTVNLLCSHDLRIIWSITTICSMLPGGQRPKSGNSTIACLISKRVITAWHTSLYKQESWHIFWKSRGIDI